MSNENDGLTETDGTQGKLVMTFDMNTIEHLGISQYGTLPPVLAEIISNAWDSDASEVTIWLNDNNPDGKEIIIADNGHGMLDTDIQKKFLKIGRNRRKIESSDKTPNGRKVIGRKGIGKLSVFGIAHEVDIITMKDQKKNQFIMTIEGIHGSTDGRYYPNHPIDNQSVDDPEEKGTIIHLKRLKRKSGFDPKKIAVNLARRFLIFDDDFIVYIIHNNDEENKIRVENTLQLDGVDVEFEWKLPIDELDSEYEYKDDVVGKIVAAKQTVPSKMKGIILMARGKLVHENSFYGLDASRYAFAYLTGWVSIDFIDDDEETDLITTNRASLRWEDERTERLRAHLQSIIHYIEKEHEKKRREATNKRIKEDTGIDIPGWINSLPRSEKKAASRMTKAILGSGMDTEKCADMVGYVQDMFGFESFRELAEEMEENTDLDDAILLRFIKEWKVIEAKELYKLAIVRVETIEKFEKYVDGNLKEVPTLHNFLKEFPWLLDPRIMNFNDEVTFSKLLKEKFNEPDTVLEHDRRIDFLCVNFTGTMFIIELKRPHHKINKKDLDQALQYRAFLTSKMGNDSKYCSTKVEAYIVGGGMVTTPEAQDMADSLLKTQKVYVRSYYELLQNAKNYHKEFIKRYDDMHRD